MVRNTSPQIVRDTEDRHRPERTREAEEHDDTEEV
jgi:hypothetical protein